MRSGLDIWHGVHLDYIYVISIHQAHKSKCEVTGRIPSAESERVKLGKPDAATWTKTELN